MTIRYHDVAHFQGSYQPTGATCAKATEGAGFTDSQYATTRARCAAKGYPFLAYHFLDHGVIAAQVAHVIKVIGRGQPLMLDVESEPDQPDSTLNDVLEFADAYRAAGGRVTLAYIPKWYWSGHWRSPSLSGLRSRGIGLVSSQYTTYSDHGPGWAAYGGSTPVIWQYTSTPLDTNAFKGTTAELAELWQYGTNGKPHPSVPVDPPEEDMPLTKTDAELVVDTLVKDENFQALIWRVYAVSNMHTVFLGGPASIKGKPVPFTAAINSLDDPGKLAAALAPLLPAGVEVDESTMAAAFVAAIKQLAAESDPAPAV